jgi:hypothetical protein
MANLSILYLRKKRSSITKNYSEMRKNKNIFLILTFVGVYLLASGVSWIAFSLLGENESSNNPATADVTSSRSKINLDMPKTEACPINGMMYTKSEREIWEGRDPLLAIIENHVDSRPPSGLSRSDVTYEAVAEGGITRFLNVFYCGVSSQDWRIGPIRSARVYFINWASEYGKNPLFLHVGGANNICKDCPGGVKPYGQVSKEVNAFDLLEKIGWRGAKGNAMDGGTNIGYPIVWRDYERIPGAATEHTYLGSTDKLFEEGVSRGFGYKDVNGNPWNKNFVYWKFIDDKPVSNPSVSKISFEFWANKPDYDVEWDYDAENNRYLRTNGGKPHMDMETKEQLAAKNVVVMFVEEKGPVDKEGHMFYQNIGTGRALVFQNGTVIEGTWKKDSREARTKFTDNKGSEISFVRGKVWIEALPNRNEIKY